MTSSQVMCHTILNFNTPMYVKNHLSQHCNADEKELLTQNGYNNLETKMNIKVHLIESVFKVHYIDHISIWVRCCLQELTDFFNIKNKM